MRLSMFGWFAPRCPVDAGAKEWIESRLRWLCDEFGRDVLIRRAMILPTSDFFPDPVENTERSLRNLLDQVCGYMDVSPRDVDLELFKRAPDLWLVNDSGRYLPVGAAGIYDEVYGRVRIEIEVSEVRVLANLVGTMSHELAHLKLIGERRVTGDEFDNELLTDLTSVFHGFGIFLGNCPRNWDSQYSTWPGTTLKRPEYMTLPIFAYALAHVAWLRNESRPEWAGHMNGDLRACFRQALRYLEKTGDSRLADQ